MKRDGIAGRGLPLPGRSFPRFPAFPGSLALLLFASLCMAASLSPEEKRGRRLYRKMESAGGDRITAFVGKESMPVPGAALPCINCHDTRGKGKEEAGVIAPNITWVELTKPYGAYFEGGRRRPAYTEEALRRVIAEGVDPGGSRLESVMPRYRMSDRDLADLVSFLRVLGEETEPGVSRDAVVVGTLLPSAGPLKEAGDSMRGVLSAYFADLNRSGGIYNRKIEFRVESYPGPGAALLAAAQRLAGEDEVFALVSGFTIGADRDLAKLVEEKEVPLVGPFTLIAQETLTLNRYSFYLYSGVEQQAGAFLVWATGVLPNFGPKIAIVAGGDDLSEGAASSLDKAARTAGWKRVERIRTNEKEFDPPRLFGSDPAKAPGIVLFFGPWKELRMLVDHAGRIGWEPILYAPGSRVRKDVFNLPDSFQGKIVLSYPTVPSDVTEKGAKELAGLQKRHGIPGKHPTAQIAALSAAKVLVEGLKQAGKDLDRETFVLRLEKMYDFDTGLTPRIGYGPNRRVGALGAHLIRVDREKKAFVPLGWFSPEGT